MAGKREIAEELASVCLSHEDFSNYFKASVSAKDDATKVGEKIGEFYNAILQTLKVETSATPKTKTSSRSKT